MLSEYPAQTMFIEWQPDFDLGVADIDSQHRQLLALVNRLAVVVTSAAAVDQAVDAISALIDGSQMHFDFEEALMERVGYSGLALHHEQHSELLAAMTRLREQLVHEHHSINTVRTLAFLRDWFTIHIVRTDSDLAEFLRARFAAEILA